MCRVVVLLGTTKARFGAEMKLSRLAAPPKVSGLSASPPAASPPRYPCQPRRLARLGIGSTRGSDGVSIGGDAAAERARMARVEPAAAGAASALALQAMPTDRAGMMAAGMSPFPILSNKRSSSLPVLMRASTVASSPMVSAGCCHLGRGVLYLGRGVLYLGYYSFFVLHDWLQDLQVSAPAKSG